MSCGGRQGSPPGWPKFLWCGPTSALLWALWVPAPLYGQAALPGEALGPVFVWGADGSPTVDQRSALASPPAAGAQTAVDGRFVIRRGQLAGVAVRPGDEVRVLGVDLELGLGFGSEPSPSAIVWWPGRDVLRVPSWSAARFVVARAAGRALRRAGRPLQGQFIARAEPWDGQRWFRFERAVGAWLAGALASDAEAALRALAPDHDASALLDRLLSLAALCRLAELPPPQTRRLLRERFADDSAYVRPLRPPHVVRAAFEVSGGRKVALRDGRPALALSAGERLRFTAPAADGLRLSIEVRRPGRTRAVVTVGDRRVALVDRHPPRGADGALWTAPASLRVPLRGGRGELRVVRGMLRVSLTAWAVRPAVVDLLAVREPVASLPAWLSAPIASPFAAESRRSAGSPTPAPVADRVAAARAALRALRSSERSALDVATRLHIHAQMMAVAAYLPRRHVRALLRAPLQRLWEDGYRGPVSWLDAVADTGFAGRPERRAEVPLVVALLRTWPLRAARDADEDVDDNGEALLQSGDHGEALLRLGKLERAPLGSRVVRWLRALWFTLSPHRALPAAAGARVEVRPHVPSDGVIDESAIAALESCSVRGRDLPRWTWLPAGVERAIDVVSLTDQQADQQATHVRVDIRSEATPARADSRVYVDGHLAVVHGTLGRGARVAVRPGRHRFRVEGPTVLIRAPRAGVVPCDELRVLRRWYRPPAPGEPVRFPLSGVRAGRVRIEVEAAPGPGPGGPVAGDGPTGGFSELQVSRESSAEVLRVWVRRGLPVRFELPVSSTPGELTVRARPSHALAVRLLAPIAQPALSPPRHIAFAPAQDADQVTVQALLDRIRAIGRRLRAELSPALAARLRSERARLLRDLGQFSLAADDRAELGDSAEAADLPQGSNAGGPADERVGATATRPSLTLPALSLMLPAHAADVVVLGRDALLPPLSAPQPARAPAGQGPDGQLLLTATAAEEAGLPERAAEAYYGIYRGTGALAALQRAAEQLAEAAALAQDRKLALQAFLWASELAALGGDARALFARLSPGVTWMRPIAVAAAGTVTLEQDLSASSEESSLYDLARRALLDAPADAALLSSQRMLRVELPRGRAIRLRGRCRTLSVPQQGCLPALEVAGAPRTCQRQGADGAVQQGADGAVQQGADGAVQQGTDGAFVCDVAASRRAQAVQLRLPAGDDALAFVRAEYLDGRPVERKVRSTWHDIDPARPLTVAVAGPTVVRVRARRLVGAPILQVRAQPLESSAEDRAAEDRAAEDRAADRTPTVSRRLPLPAQADPAVTFVGGSSAQQLSIGRATEHLWVVDGEGPTTVTIGLDDGRALVALAVASLQQAPMQRSSPPAPVAPPGGPMASRSFGVPDPYVSDRALLLPADRVLATPNLAVGASLAAVSRTRFDDDDTVENTFVELSTFAAFAPIADALWFDAVVFGRLRAQEDSGGAAFSGTWAPAGVDGWTLRGRLQAVTQNVPRPTSAVEQAADRGDPVDNARGLRASLLAYTTFLLTSDLRLRPTVALSARRADRRAQAATHADSEVYSRWSADHPLTIAPELSLLQRIAADAQLRYGLATRVSTAPRLDRVDLWVGIDTMPLPRPFPWLTGGLSLSHRPHNDYRSRAFTRGTLTLRARFFDWLTTARLWTVSVELQQRLDVPAVGNSAYALAGTVLLRMEAFSGDGLSALPPNERILRSFREEGVGRVQTRTGRWVSASVSPAAVAR